MDWRKTLTDYSLKFQESIGIPWDGFSNDRIEREYFEALRRCVEIGKPLTQEQRKYFFPGEDEELPEGILY